MFWNAPGKNPRAERGTRTTVDCGVWIVDGGSWTVAEVVDQGSGKRISITWPLRTLCASVLPAAISRTSHRRQSKGS